MTGDFSQKQGDNQHTLLWPPSSTLASIYVEEGWGILSSSRDPFPFGQPPRDHIPEVSMTRWKSGQGNLCASDLWYSCLHSNHAQVTVSSFQESKRSRAHSSWVKTFREGDLGRILRTKGGIGRHHASFCLLILLFGHVYQHKNKQWGGRNGQESGIFP